MKPLVSVIIPTANRPHYLPRAVKSALDGENVEVIVIPNGSDLSWVESLAPFKKNSSVKIIPIEETNANIARNIGMDNAHGKFIRFLDDDDYLIPEGAINQYELIKETNADICSGLVNLIDHNGNQFGCWGQPQSSDFIEGMLSSKRMSQVTAHVFKRSLIQNKPWNNQLNYSQDIEWMLRIGSLTELNWIKLDIPVGNWLRHVNNRISTKAPLHDRKKIIALAIIASTQDLQTQARLTENRKKSAADGLWECVHSTFFMNPLYWLKISTIANKMYPDSHPNLFFYQFPWVKKLNWYPIVWVVLATPKMYSRYILKRIFLNLKILKKW